MDTNSDRNRKSLNRLMIAVVVIVVAMPVITWAIGHLH